MQPNIGIDENGDSPGNPPRSRKARRKQRYELQQQIGAGGMGIVYRAFDRELNRIVAVKVLRPEYASSLAGLLRLKRELLLASQVSDRHVVRVYDVGEVDGKASISMDWVDGESLATLLRRVHRLPPSQVYDFATQIAKALSVIHHAYIVHRDLKPGNLLISRNGEVLVTDFGLARSDRPLDVSLNEPGGVLGTPRYMAPEQLAGLPADVRSDLYAFGLILLEMLTGTTSLEALDPLRVRQLEVDTGRHIRSEELRKLAMLDAVIRRCLKLDRNERYPNADTVVADLTRGDFEVLQPESRRNLATMSRLKLAASVSLGVALVAFLAFQTSSLHVKALVTQSETVDDSSDRPYSQALTLMTPAAGESELRSAERALNEALSKRPAYLPAIRLLVEVRIRLYEATLDGEWLFQARQALQRAAAMTLPDEQRTLFQARIDLNANLFVKVVEELRSNQALLASSADANRLLGRALEGSGELSSAIPWYRTAVRLSPESWKSHNDLGSALLGSGLLEQAAAEFRKVTGLQPDSSVGFSNLGLALLYKGDPVGAQQNFERALERRASPAAYFNLGLTAYLLHQYASSLPFFESALRMRPNSDVYVSSLAASLWHLQKKAAARNAYVHALALLDEEEKKRPLTTVELCRRALDYSGLGDSEMAKMTLDAVSRSRPEDQDVLIAEAVVGIRDGQKEAARKMVAKALLHGYPAGLARLNPELEGLCPDAPKPAALFDSTK